jgi:DNA invertase Pin-like site-specific DNA recombinase
MVVGACYAEMAAKLIGYIRVSTKQQGESGLGLEAQQAALEAYRAGVKGQFIKIYREVESGKRADRPEIRKALAHAKRAGAVVVIAKLDRLSRNVAFTANLMEAGADFVACDNPTANKLTIHILAAVAEDEARRISERTIAALAAYKARGGVLGSHRPGAPQITREAARRGSARAAELRREQAAAAVADLAGEIVELRATGRVSLRQIAEYLHSEGHTTPRGARWTATQVWRVLERSGKNSVNNR